MRGGFYELSTFVNPFVRFIGFRTDTVAEDIAATVSAQYAPETNKQF